MSKPNDPEREYTLLHAECLGILKDIQDALQDLPAPEGEIKIDWTHVGSLQEIRRQLRETRTFVWGAENGTKVQRGVDVRATRHASAAEAYQSAEASGWEPLLIRGVPYTVTSAMREEMQIARCTEVGDIVCRDGEILIVPWKV